MRIHHSGLAVAACLTAVLTLGAGPAAAQAGSSVERVGSSVTQVGSSAPQCGPKFSDALPELPWPLRRLDPRAAWPTSRGRGVIVAVIDSGVSRLHPKLAGQVLPGKDFVQPGGAGDCDMDGHGTLVAGIIAGRDTKDAPFFGIAPDAHILPVRVLPDSRKSTDPELPKRIASALVWAVNHGADVVNMSLVTEPTPELADAVAYAVRKHVVVVAAAGNEGGSPQAGKPVYPAAYDDVIAVAGVDQDGKHVSTSNTGDYVDIAAPGLAIEGPAPRGGGYVIDPQGGTSFAAAYVSGVAALIREHSPSLSASDIRRRLQLTADSPADGNNDEVGFGVVNPYRAVATLLEPTNKRTPAVSGQLPPPQRADDPLATVRAFAGWAFAGGLILAVLLLATRSLLRRGRRRGQQPVATPANSGAGRVQAFSPVFDAPVRITAPSVRRSAETPAVFVPPGFEQPGSSRRR